MRNLTQYPRSFYSIHFKLEMNVDHTVDISAQLTDAISKKLNAGGFTKVMCIVSSVTKDLGVGEGATIYRAINSYKMWENMRNNHLKTGDIVISS